MEPKLNKVVLRYGVHGEIVEREISTAESISYRVGDAVTPGCLRVYHGRKTYIVPLVNLAMVELDV